MNFKVFLGVLICLYEFSSVSSNLNKVDDNNLLDLMRENRNLVVLFSKSNCEKCDLFENAVLKIKEHLEEDLKAEIIKVTNSQMVRLYNPFRKEPALVFFRHGVPLLYDGEPIESDIYEMFNAHKEPLVKELSDETFEHLTQAATGSTTGDWLIMFYSPDCVDCQRMVAMWESIAAQIRSRATAARVNRVRGGVATAKRFKIEKSPEIVLLRQGKFYRYDSKTYDIKTIVNFAQSWYKNVPGEKVPVPATPFENLVDFIVKKLKEMPSFSTIRNEYPIPLIGILSAIFLTFIVILYSRFQKPPKKTSSSTKQKGADPKAPTDGSKKKKQK